MQSDFVFWLNTIVIFFGLILFGIHIFSPDKKGNETRRQQREEKETLLALLREVIQALRAPDAARLMASALLKQDIQPFVRFIKGLQDKLQSFLINLIGRDAYHKLEEDMLFQIRDTAQHEPLNSALSVERDSLGDLIRMYDGELATVGSIHLYSLLAGWKRLRHGYGNIKESMGVPLTTGSGALWLPPATERIIRLTSHVNVHADGVTEHSLKVLVEVWEGLQDERVPSALRERLMGDIQRVRGELANAPRVSATDHHLASEHPRLEAEAEAVYIETGCLTARVVELCAAWFLVSATLEIQRKHDALEAGKSAFTRT